MKTYTELVERKQAQYGSEFNSKELNKDFIHAYETGKRIEVQFRTQDGKIYETKRGTVGVTTGWKPCFLLMLTKRSIGSSWTIGMKDVIGKYINYPH
mgnify:FL=1